MKKIVLIPLVLCSLLVISSCSTNEVTNSSQIQEQNIEGVTPISPKDIEQQLNSIDKATISQTEIDSIIWMREEEKLAKDVYTTLGQVWGINIFTNISSAEQTHTDSVKTLIDRYGLEDPITDETIGIFKNETFSKLYQDLVKQGSSSLVEALKVGALIEELDIKDLQERVTTTADIDLVFQNLERGSRNHLRAFTRQLSQQGENYVPIYISQSEFDEIIGSEVERGMSN
jgi:hypothetical protein